MSIQGARPVTPQVTAHLIVRDITSAIAFYQRAFGATVLFSAPMPQGLGGHAHLQIGESVILVSSEIPATAPQVASPESVGRTTVMLELYVPDVDAHYQRALDAGAVPYRPIIDRFFGDRYGQILDPFGHVWALATMLEALTPEQVRKQMTTTSV